MEYEVKYYETPEEIVAGFENGTLEEEYPMLVEAIRQIIAKAMLRMIREKK